MGIMLTSNIEEATRSISHDASFLGNKRIYERKYLGNSFLTLEIGKVSPEIPEIIRGGDPENRRKK